MCLTHEDVFGIQQPHITGNHSLSRDLRAPRHICNLADHTQSSPHQHRGISQETMLNDPEFADGKEKNFEVVDEVSTSDQNWTV